MPPLSWHGTYKPADQAKPSAVYRCFDADGALLYIGRTMHPAKRESLHKNRTPWWSDVARVTYEWCDSTAAARVAEREAIGAEAPRYNRALNPSRPPDPLPASGIVTARQLRW